LGGGRAGPAACPTSPDLFAVGMVKADSLPAHIFDAGPGGLYVRDADGPSRTAPVDAVAFSEAFIGRDRVAAVEVWSDNWAEQVLRAGPPELDLDFGALRQLDSGFTFDPSSWLDQ
jgi:hypothetical protein